MKKSICVIVCCVFLIAMPIGLSDCGCDQDRLSANPTDQTSGTGLSSLDIETLREQGKQEGWTFTVGENPATSIPLNQLCGLKEPENWWVDARFDPCTPTRELPEQFDWREISGCPPVRNQGSCGSCWAFATVGPLECSIMINESKEVDLSEQWLVSCNRDGWGCGGGWWAHNYHQWKTDSCGGTGAVLEEDFPYVADDVPCDCPYDHAYKINDWAYIGSEYGIPSVDAIKTAIMEHGPVCVAVYVTSAFHSYSEGVFNNCQHGQVNHGVVLVGWDDNQGTNGVWFLRNSWGPGWGEDGYMRIEYGCSEVGYAATYIDTYAGLLPPIETELAVDITGGIGVTIYVTNVGEKDATDVDIEATINGGFLRLVNASLTETKPLMNPQEVISLSSIAFGLGSITIKVVADASNADKVTKEANAFLIGIFVIIT